jgi:tetratricopeptide (TPR) repeat protein
MKRVLLPIVLIALLVPAGCYFWSASTVPAHRYRLWLSYAQEGFSELRAGNAQEAEKVYRKCLAIANAYSSATLEQAVAQAGVADALCAQRQYEAASQLYGHAISLYQRASGDVKKRSAVLFQQEDCLLSLAQCFARQGIAKSADTETAYKNAMELAAHLPEQSTEYRVDAQRAYADYLESIDKKMAAKYYRLLARCEQTLQQNSARYEIENTELAAELKQAGDEFKAANEFDKARWAYSESDKVQARLADSDPARRFPALFNMAEMLRARGERDKAFEIHVQLKDIVEKRPEKHPDLYFAILTSISMDLMEMNRRKEADKYLKLALLLARQRVRVDPNGLATIAFFLGENLKYQYAFDQSEEAYQEGIAARGNFPSKDYPTLSDMYFHLGHLYLVNKKYSKAENCLNQAVAIV